MTAPTAARIQSELAPVQLTTWALRLGWSRKPAFLASAAIALVGVAIPIATAASAEQARLDTIRALESPDLRTIAIEDTGAEGGPTLTRAVVADLAHLGSVESVLVVAGAEDLRPAPGWPQSERIPTIEILDVLDDTPCGAVWLPSGLAHRWPTITTLHSAVEQRFLPVVGIRDDPRGQLAPPASFAVHRPCEWDAARSVALLVRRSTDVDSVVVAVREIVGRNTAISVPTELAGLRAELVRGLGGLEQRMRLLPVGAAVLILTTMSYLSSVSQARQHALRRALGATRAELVALVAVPTVVSALLGGVAALALAGCAAVFGVPIGFDHAVAVAVALVIASTLTSATVGFVSALRSPAEYLRAA